MWSRSYAAYLSLTISRHTRLARNTSSYDNDVCTGKSLLETSVIRKIAADLGLGVNVHQISRDAWNMYGIVQRDLVEKVAFSQNRLGMMLSKWEFNVVGSTHGLA